MTRNFDSLGAFAVHLLEREVATVVAMHAGLERCLQKIETTAKSEFGIYQPAIGLFGSWPELADATKAERVDLGFTPNDPLLRLGELLDSVEHEKVGLEGVVGVKWGKAHTAYYEGGPTPDMGDLMVWHEMGTEHVPPRPVLGPAAIRSKSAVEKIMAVALVEGIAGGHVIGTAEYDFSAIT